MVVEALLGVPWEELEREHLEAFLDTAGDEGLTWEVKGDRKASRWPRPEQVYEPACAFGNSVDGGLLIIGAERRRSERGNAVTGWDLRGLHPPNEEVPLWLGRQLARVRPAPRQLPPKVWDISEECRAAVILVEPVPDPPCVTPDGRVLQRVSGATTPVTDPLTLSRLQQRGEAAHRQAQDTAETVAAATPDLPDRVASPAQWPDQGRLTVGLAAVGYQPDIGGRLFGKDFLERVMAAREGLHTEWGGGPSAQAWVWSRSGVRRREVRPSVSGALQPPLGHRGALERRRLGYLCAIHGRRLGLAPRGGPGTGMACRC